MGFRRSDHGVRPSLCPTPRDENRRVFDRAVQGSPADERSRTYAAKHPPLRFLGPHENLYRTLLTRRTNLAGGGAFHVAIKAPTGA